MAARESRGGPAPARRSRKGNGTYRINDGRHRFLAYVLAERPLVPIEVETPSRPALVPTSVTIVEEHHAGVLPRGPPASVGAEADAFPHMGTSRGRRPTLSDRAFAEDSKWRIYPMPESRRVA